MLEIALDEFLSEERESSLESSPLPSSVPCEFTLLPFHCRITQMLVDELGPLEARLLHPRLFLDVVPQLLLCPLPAHVGVGIAHDAEHRLRASQVAVCAPTFLNGSTSKVDLPQHGLRWWRRCQVGGNALIACTVQCVIFARTVQQEQSTTHE